MNRGIARIETFKPISTATPEHLLIASARVIDRKLLKPLNMNNGHINDPDLFI